MSRYVTISVPVEVKKRLEKLKGSLDWGTFLLKLVEEYEHCKKEKAFKKLTEILTIEDLNEIEASYKNFRKRFKLRMS